MKIKTCLLPVCLAAAFTAFASATPAPATALLEAMKVTAASNSLVSDLQIGHSEAVRRNSRVLLCKSADGTACANSGSWSQGWIVFEDANGNGVRDSQEPLIVRVPALSRSLRFSGSMDAVNAVSFGQHGAVKLAGAAAAASLTICSGASQPAQAAQIELKAGRALDLRQGVVSGCA